jgi:hypothetical protein
MWVVGLNISKIQFLDLDIDVCSTQNVMVAPQLLRGLDTDCPISFSYRPAQYISPLPNNQIFVCEKKIFSPRWYGEMLWEPLYCTHQPKNQVLYICVLVFACDAQQYKHQITNRIPLCISEFIWLYRTNWRSIQSPVKSHQWDTSHRLKNIALH